MSVFPLQFTNFTRPTGHKIVTLNDPAINSHATNPGVTYSPSCTGGIGGTDASGWCTDALARPSVCRNLANTGWVMTVSGWNTANAKWRSGFLTSPDLFNWTLVNGSILDQNSYLTGNAGIVAFGGLYYMVINLGAGGGVLLYSSPDLVTWTDTGKTFTGFDPGINLNPTNGKIEITSLNRGATPNHVVFYDSVDAVTWSSSSILYSAGTWQPATFGEFHIGYCGGERYATFDNGTGLARLICMARQRASGSWNEFGSILTYDENTSWESVQVFDSQFIGNANGNSILTGINGVDSALWMTFAGSDNTSATDATHSSIGISYLPVTIPANSITGIVSITI